MKKVLFLFSFLVIAGNYAFGQCGACAVNTACTVTPAAPQLCPAALPDGTVGVYYDQDATFYMPAQFQTQGITVTLNQINVTSITGIPAGLTFACSDPNCTYFPSQNPPATERGCVKICGTPTIPGDYTVTVSVVAQVSTPLGPVTQPEQFIIPIRINPPAGGNGSFTFNPPGGCDSVCVTFEGIIEDPVKPTTWAWDFGNGQTSSVKQPPVQCFNTPGQHIVSLQTQILDYVLDAVTFTVTGNGWCGDVEEPSNVFTGGCFGSPDPYFIYSNGSNSFSQENNYADNNASGSWTGLNRTLESPTFALTFYDYDPTSQDDNLGTIAANVTGTGTFNFTTSQGFGTYTIITTPSQTFNDTDTIFVYTPPSEPVVSNITALDSICVGDSILLVSTPSSIYQWYNDTTAITGAEDDSLWVTASGSYWVNILDANGCTNNNQNSPTALTVLNFPPVPGLFYSNNGATINSTIPSGVGFTFQWFYSQQPNSGGLPIPNQTNPTINPSLVGYYYLTVYNALDCANYSDTVYWDKTGISDILNDITDIKIYPNPSQDGQFTLEMGLNGVENTAIIVRNVVGQTVYNENLGKQTGKIVRGFNLPLAKGMYIVEIARPAGSITRKLVIE